MVIDWETFYVDMFGKGGSTWGTIKEDVWTSEDCVNTLESFDLIAPFSEEEIKSAVFDMEGDKAPGPDGFPAEFF